MSIYSDRTAIYGVAQSSSKATVKRATLTPDEMRSLQTVFDRSDFIAYSGAASAHASCSGIVTDYLSLNVRVYQPGGSVADVAFEYCSAHPPEITGVRQAISRLTSQLGDRWR